MALLEHRGRNSTLVTGRRWSRFFEGQVRCSKTFSIARTPCALALQKNDARHVVISFLCGELPCRAKWMRSYSCVSLLVRKRAPEQAYGGAGGACEEKGAHEKGAWPPPYSPRKIKGRP
jgi:hypothetical protein